MPKIPIINAEPGAGGFQQASPAEGFYLGRQIKNAGSEFDEVAQKLKQQQDRHEIAQLQSDYERGVGEIRLGLDHNSDPDQHTTLFPVKYEELRARLLSGPYSDSVKNTFNDYMNQRFGQDMVDVEKGALALKNNKVIALNDAMIDSTAREVSQITDPKVVYQKKEQARSLIEGLEKAGVVTPVQAQARREELDRKSEEYTRAFLAHQEREQEKALKQAKFDQDHNMTMKALAGTLSIGDLSDKNQTGLMDSRDINFFREWLMRKRDASTDPATALKIRDLLDQPYKNRESEIAAAVGIKEEIRKAMKGSLLSNEHLMKFEQEANDMINGSKLPKDPWEKMAMDYVNDKLKYNELLGYASSDPNVPAARWNVLAQLQKAKDENPLLKGEDLFKLAKSLTDPVALNIFGDMAKKATEAPAAQPTPAPSGTEGLGDPSKYQGRAFMYKGKPFISDGKSWKPWVKP